MNKPMMKCGHAANAYDQNGHPVCVICIGIVQGATGVDDNPPDLSGREAECDCGKRKPSSSDLAFFEHRANKATDSYYCGHAGWD